MQSSSPSQKSEVSSIQDQQFEKVTSRVNLRGNQVSMVMTDGSRGGRVQGRETPAGRARSSSFVRTAEGGACEVDGATVEG